MVFVTRFYFTFAVSLLSFNTVKGDGCINETLTATKKVKHLTSPGYPLDYKNNLQCTWEIVGPQYSKIRVKVLSSDIDRQGSCEGDYVEVLDGSATDKDVASLGSCWGSSTPSSFTSSGHVITIRFITDGSGTSKGFRLKYYYVDSQIERTGSLYGFGIFVGSIFFLFVLSKISLRCARQRHRGRIELETQHQLQTGDTEAPTEIVDPTRNNAELSAPPPTYNEAVSNGSVNSIVDNLDETSPPPYSTLRISHI